MKTNLIPIGIKESEKLIPCKNTWNLEQIESFLMFHIYFTVRGIHFEMGGIQSESALPGNPPFNQLNNGYDTPAFKRIWAESGISSDRDFRFKEGDNRGLGSVFIYVANPGP